MSKMKTRVIPAIVAAMALSMLAGCGGKDKTADAADAATTVAETTTQAEETTAEETKAEDISKYAEDNLVVLTLFAQLMKEQKYDKAMKLYKPINSELGNGRELSEHEIKEFDWSNYNIYNSTGFFGINTYMINNYDKKINVMVNVDHTICHIYETNI